MAPGVGRGGTVFIVEEDELSFADHILTGRFRASWQTQSSVRDVIEGLTVEDAIAWARDRCDRVLIRLGGEDIHYSAGTVAVGREPEWPPADLPALVRRRHPRLAHLDRTEADAPIGWAVTAWIGPKRTLDGPHGRQLWLEDADDAVDRVARNAGALWDDEHRLLLRRDIQRAERAARRNGHPGDYGWSSNGRDAYRLRITVEAPTQELASAAARQRIDLPEDLVLENVEAVPVGP